MATTVATYSYEIGDVAEMWYQRMWRPGMAAIYMFLCILDYGVRPMINYYQSTNYDLPMVVRTIENLEPSAQIEVLRLSSQKPIDPILTEFVHLAFGAILGVAAFSRGSSKGFAEGSPNRAPTPQTPSQPIVQNKRRQEIDDPDGEEADG